MEGITCPYCGAPEETKDRERIHIRAFKTCIDGIWYSQCLVCSGGYDKINGTFTEDNHDGNAGWFKNV